MIATPAFAHISLERSSPRNGEVLATPLTEVRIRFSGGVEPRYTSLQLFDSQGQEVSTAALRVVSGSENREFAGALTEPLATPGQYRVEWKTAGADGHIMAGTFSFTIGVVARAVTGADTQELPPEHHIAATESSPNASGAAVAVRWLHFSALITLIGVVVFRFRVAPRSVTVQGGERLVRHAGERAVRLATIAMIATAVALIARLWLQSAALHGVEYTWDSERLATMLMLTRWGNVWLLQLAAVVIMAPGLLLARRPAGARTGWRLILIAVFAMAFVPALSGHAAAITGWAAIAVATDVTHVIAVGAWIGTLIALIVCGVPASRTLDKGKRVPAFAALVSNFSSVAVGAVTIVIATGAISTILHLNSPSDLLRTDYGRTLLTKLGILLLVLGTGLYNWRFVQPALTGEGGARRLRRSATIEIVIGLAVILVTAVLVALPTP